jgi:Flp pilus assembly protein TadD
MSDLRQREHKSEAERAFMEAIELGIQERSPYPEHAIFIDAERPQAGVAIARAATEGKPVVLCSADGSRQVLYPSAPAAA